MDNGVPKQELGNEKRGGHGGPPHRKLKTENKAES